MRVWSGGTATVMVLGVTLAAMQPAAAPPPTAATPQNRPLLPSRLSSDLAHLREEARRHPAGRLVIANDAYHAAFDASTGVTVTPRLAGTLEPARYWLAVLVPAGGTVRR
ncbi:MAG: hypothetical protein ABIT71_12380 [Vicinamibacteraceae bacterium]